MVARFPGDGQVYRAKVTAVRKAPDLKTYYDLLYIDYGNSYKDLEENDLGKWDSVYEMIPPQAFLSSFIESLEVREMKPEVFQTFMINQGAMKMEIFKVSPSKCGFFNESSRDFGKNVELLVSLTTKTNKNVCEMLASNSAILGQDQPRPRSPQWRPTASQDQLLLSLNVPPASLLRPPPPLHLPAGLAPSPPLSPIPLNNTTKSIQKVIDWDCSVSQVSNEVNDEVRDSAEPNRRMLKRSWRGKVGRSSVIELLSLTECFVQVAQRERDG